MAAKEIVVKKYVVRLSYGERALLETLIRKGSSSVIRLLFRSPDKAERVQRMFRRGNRLRRKPRLAFRAVYKRVGG